MEVINQIIEFLAANYVVILSVLGFLFMVAKRVSNEKAGVVVGAIQKFFDGAAKVLEALSKACAMIGKLLADLLKSDGIGGVK